ncbi:SUF system Fe-S cluster assembly regulator [Rhodospirillum centenum]|uniref:Rrf2 family protein (Putative transcriptional regulator) n=1 Tax=Rhodospirillum centenum (strain ATCC 51521 / SW) TaxID=414684 RepID=B6IR45_RHOCS|nr:SUF system Fe-S cluster assembly regulator [Rhodospirillum centenum]ACI97931.1 rrf2 family protein (putative transcriptional regulator) [Rhodospirillum centenum SW]
MLRLSKLTDYAVVVLTAMARSDAPVHTAASLAERTGLPVPTVQKLLKQLARGGILASQRGAAGGYALLREDTDVTVAEIIEAIDGPIALTDCVDGAEGACGVQSLCPRRGSWDKVNEAVRRALDGVSLADMALPSIPDFGIAPALATDPRSEDKVRRAALAG